MGCVNTFYGYFFVFRGLYMKNGMKTLFRGLVFYALVTSSLNSSAMSSDNMESDSNMYVGGSLVGVYNTKETASIHTDESWVGLVSGGTTYGSSTKKTFTLSMDNDLNWGGQARFGYVMNGGYTLEGSVNYSKLNASLFDDSSDATIFSKSEWNLNVNALMNFENSSQFTPHIGLGLGVGIQNIDFSDWNYSGNIVKSKVAGSAHASVTHFNFKNAFKINASGDNLKSEWKFGPEWQIFGGVGVDLVPNQVVLTARASLGSAFAKIKFTSSTDESVFVQYKTLKTAGTVGIDVHF